MENSTYRDVEELSLMAEELKNRPDSAVYRVWNLLLNRGLQEI